VQADGPGGFLQRGSSASISACSGELISRKKSCVSSGSKKKIRRRSSLDKLGTSHATIACSLVNHDHCVGFGAQLIHKKNPTKSGKIAKTVVRHTKIHVRVDQRQKLG